MKIGIIGFGNLGKALVNGLLSKNILPKENIFICAKSAATIECAQADFNIFGSTDINDILKKAEIIFLVIKGNIFEEIGPIIDYTLLEGKTIISMMAGITIEEIKRFLKTPIIIRAMPSLAIATGNGVICYTETTQLEIIDVFDNLGLAIKIGEKDIEKFTALGSCGLGFAAYILEAFVLSGTNLGFDYSMSLDIISKTFADAIKLSDFNNLLQSVATKGGATEKGIDVFNENKTNDIIFQAINSAYQKACGERTE